MSVYCSIHMWWMYTTAEILFGSERARSVKTVDELIDEIGIGQFGFDAFYQKYGSVVNSKYVACCRQIWKSLLRVADRGCPCDVAPSSRWYSCPWSWSITGIDEKNSMIISLLMWQSNKACIVLLINGSKRSWPVTVLCPSVAAIDHDQGFLPNTVGVNIPLGHFIHQR